MTMKSLKTIQAELTKKKEPEGEKFRVRIPAPDKEMAKEAGAKWNPTLNGYYVVINDMENHPLAEYVITNNAWCKLEAQIPFSYKEEFKAYGVVTEKNEETGQWESYVLATEKYFELINTLVALDLLKVGA